MNPEHKDDQNISSYLTIKEACAFLNVTESWLRRQIFLKTIPFKKLGGLIRLDKTELLAWINQSGA